MTRLILVLALMGCTTDQLFEAKDFAAQGYSRWHDTKIKERQGREIEIRRGCNVSLQDVREAITDPNKFHLGILCYYELAF